MLLRYQTKKSAQQEHELGKAKWIRWLMTLSVASASPALANDFRVLDWGESCAPVLEREKVMGSKPLAWNPSGPEYLAFEDEAFGKRLSILYFCPRGALFSGNYFFPPESFDGALGSLRLVYDELTSRYGLPWLDTTPWQPNQDPRAVAAGPSQYMVTWVHSRTRTSISVKQIIDAPGATWRVFVVATENVQ